MILNDLSSKYLLFAELPRGLFNPVFCLRDFRGAQTIWFFICGSSAEPKPFGFLFAELPRSPNYLVSRLRKFRKTQTIWFLVCGSSAKPKLFGFSSAELPRSSNHLVSHLRNSREAQTVWFLACGSSARLFQYVFLFGRAIYCPIPLRALPAPTRAERPHVGKDPEG